MSAELLREAAALMRERAEAATAGRWFPFGNSVGAQVDHCNCHGPVPGSPHEQGCGIDGPIAEAHATDAQHIASWHPDAAIAVADLLDMHVERMETTGFVGHAHANLLAVARAYLGRSA